MQDAVRLDDGQVEIVDQLGRRSIAVGRPCQIVPGQGYPHLGLPGNNREDELVGDVSHAQLVFDKPALLDELDSRLGIHQAKTGGPVGTSAIGYRCVRVRIDSRIGTSQVGRLLDQDGLDRRGQRRSGIEVHAKGLGILLEQQTDDTCHRWRGHGGTTLDSIAVATYVEREGYSRITWGRIASTVGVGACGHNAQAYGSNVWFDTPVHSRPHAGETGVGQAVLIDASHADTVLARAKNREITHLVSIRAPTRVLRADTIGNTVVVDVPWALVRVVRRCPDHRPGRNARAVAAYNAIDRAHGGVIQSLHLKHVGVIGHVHPKVVDGIIVDACVASSATIGGNARLRCHATPLEWGAGVKIAVIVDLIALHTAAGCDARYVGPVIATAMLATDDAAGEIVVVVVNTAVHDAHLDAVPAQASINASGRVQTLHHTHIELGPHIVQRWQEGNGTELDPLDDIVVRQSPYPGRGGARLPEVW